MALKRILVLFGFVGFSVWSPVAPAADTVDDVPALEKLAEQNNAQAQTDLGIRYEHAQGVPKDYARAADLYCRAAKQGNPDAQYNLGWMYANGRGLARDDGVAAVLFDMAAKQGHVGAQRMLKFVGLPKSQALPPCETADKDDSTAVVAQGDAGSLERLSQAMKMSPAQRRQIEAMVNQLAPEYALDPNLVMAVIAVESGFTPLAKSPKNAQGLMQLIPDTAKRFGVKNSFDAKQNLKGGMAYLRWLMAFFKGQIPLVLAAYNAGERAVEKYRGIPPYAETKAYVQKITRLYPQLAHPYQNGVIAAAPMMSSKKFAGIEQASYRPELNNSGRVRVTLRP